MSEATFAVPAPVTPPTAHSSLTTLQATPAASASSPPPSASNATAAISDGVAGLRSALTRLTDNSLVEVMEALETLLVYTRNLIAFPDEKKYRKIKMSNIHYVERLGHLQGAMDAMSAIGYVPIGEYLRLDERRMSRPYNETLLKECEQLITQQLTAVKSEWTSMPLRLSDAHIYSSVRGAGSHSAIGKRHNMEDDEIIVDHFAGDPLQGYFGLYDGHGGRATVDFVVKALHMNLEQYLKRHPNASLNDAFKSSYLATDGQLRRANILRSGTTSVTCVVRQIKGTGKRVLFSANVGDSRAVLCRNGRAVRLTVDHKASLPEEAKRITDAGGFIGRNKRVNGVLAISRALGDHMLKENDVVSAEPYCTDTELSDQDTYVLLACDGVWDVMSDQEAVDHMLHAIQTHTTEVEKKHEAPGADTEKKDENDENNKANGVDNDEHSIDNDSDPSPSHSPSPSPPSSSSSVPPQSRYLNEILAAAAKSLVKEALERRSLDNVTVMIVAL